MLLTPEITQVTGAAYAEFVPSAAAEAVPVDLNLILAPVAGENTPKAPLLDKASTLISATIEVGGRSTSSPPR